MGGCGIVSNWPEGRGVLLTLSNERLQGDPAQKPPLRGSQHKNTIVTGPQEDFTVGKDKVKKAGRDWKAKLH